MRWDRVENSVCKGNIVDDLQVSKWKIPGKDGMEYIYPILIKFNQYNICIYIFILNIDTPIILHESQELPTYFISRIKTQRSNGSLTFFEAIKFLRMQFLTLLNHKI